MILVSDNGYFYGEHGLSEERRLAYEESIRLPLLMRYPPGIRAGSTPAGMVLTIDIAPTILDLAGARRSPPSMGVPVALFTPGARLRTGDNPSWSSTRPTSCFRAC